MVLHVAANETEEGTNGVELSTELLLVTSGLLEVSFKHKIHETCPLSCMYSGVGSFAICYFTIYKSFRVYKNTYCVVMTHNGSLEMMRTEFLCHKDHDFSLTVIPNIQISA